MKCSVYENLEMIGTQLMQKVGHFDFALHRALLVDQSCQNSPVSPKRIYYC